MPTSEREGVRKLNRAEQRMGRLEKQFEFLTSYSLVITSACRRERWSTAYEWRDVGAEGLTSTYDPRKAGIVGGKIYRRSARAELKPIELSRMHARSLVLLGEMNVPFKRRINTRARCITFLQKLTSVSCFRTNEFNDTRANTPLGAFKRVVCLIGRSRTMLFRSSR